MACVEVARNLPKITLNPNPTPAPAATVRKQRLQYQANDSAAPGPKCHPYSEFPRPLRNSVGDDAVDAGCRERQCEHGKQAEERSDKTFPSPGLCLQKPAQLMLVEDEELRVEPVETCFQPRASPPRDRLGRGSAGEYWAPPGMKREQTLAGITGRSRPSLRTSSTTPTISSQPSGFAVETRLAFSILQSPDCEPICLTDLRLGCIAARRRGSPELRARPPASSSRVKKRP